MTTFEKVASLGILLLVGGGLYLYFTREGEKVAEAAKPAGGGGGGGMPRSLPGYGNVTPSAAPVPPKVNPTNPPPRPTVTAVSLSKPKPGPRVALLGADARVSWSSANGYTC